MPKRILKPAAGLINRLLWWDIMSADQVEREFHDQVIDETAKTFKDLGIEPSDISKWTYHYLVCIDSVPVLAEMWLTPRQKGARNSTYYDLPPATEKEMREEKKYIHVLDDQ